MELRYSHDHHWVRRDTLRRVTVGLSDFAQRELGEIAYLELPGIGMRVAAGSAVCAVESLKSAGELYAPVTGTVVECNAALAAAGGQTLINRDPLERAGSSPWRWTIRPSSNSSCPPPTTLASPLPTSDADTWSADT